MATPHPYFHISLPRPPRLGWRGRLTVFLSVSLTVYVIGFAAFVVLLPEPFTTLPDNLDGLATFTGGSGRVEAALHEAEQGFPGPILISGSSRHTTLNAMLAHTSANLTPDQQTHIVYDAAQTTRENIISLKAWAGYYKLDNVGLITSTYHVPRVRLLALMHARELSLTYLPVQPADPGIRPLFREYNKLLAAPFLR